MKDLIRAQAVIENNRKTAEKAREEKMALLMENKDFSEAYSRISYLKFELARREVFRLKQDEAILSEFKEKSAFIAETMKKNGVGEYPDYFCKKCKDTGYKNGSPCDCLEKARLEINYKDYPFLKKIPSSLTEIDCAFYEENSVLYDKRIKYLHSNFLSGDLNFCTLIGATGTGKTYLAQVIIKEALLLGNTIKIVNSVRLNREFLDYHCAPLAEKTAVWEKIADSDYLLIDDLGVESEINNVTLQYLYELLTERADKKTLITSNLSFPALVDRYGQRISSRLSDKRKSSVVEIVGKDIRFK